MGLLGVLDYDVDIFVRLIEGALETLVQLDFRYIEGPSLLIPASIHVFLRHNLVKRSARIFHHLHQIILNHASNAVKTFQLQLSFNDLLRCHQVCLRLFL